MKAPKLELVDIDSLEPHPENPNQGDIGTICDLIVHNGWFGQTLVQTREGLPDRVFVGEHRWRALKLLQSQGGVVRENGTDTPTDYAALQTRAEVLDLPGLPPVGKCWVQRYAISDRLARRHMLADNRSSELGTNDAAQLAALLSEIAEEEGLVGTGFDDETLDDLLREIASGDKPKPEDAAPDLPVVATSQPGDVLVLGDHKLLCADATDPDSFVLLMGDERADMVWTDPPYGVKIVGRTKNKLKISNDDLDAAGTERLLRGALGNAAQWSRPGAAWHVAAPGGPEMLPFAKVLTDLEIWRQTITWVKDRFVMGRSDYHYRHEPVMVGAIDGAEPQPIPPDEYLVEHEVALYGWKPGAAHDPMPDRKQDSVWEIPRPGASKDHPTMKPIELVARAVRNHTKVEALVLDPFAGSGTTLMACEQEARAARCIELDPRYCDVIVARWEKHTAQGGKADRMITVHCFACSHCVERPSPSEAHDAMEAHYVLAHGPLIARLAGRP